MQSWSNMSSFMAFMRFYLGTWISIDWHKRRHLRDLRLVTSLFSTMRVAFSIAFVFVFVLLSTIVDAAVLVPRASNTPGYVTASRLFFWSNLLIVTLAAPLALRKIPPDLGLQTTATQLGYSSALIRPSKVKIPMISIAHITMYACITFVSKLHP
jgi:hypothetical protein